jgi:hypothetical protein
MYELLALWPPALPMGCPQALQRARKASTAKTTSKARERRGGGEGKARESTDIL